MGWRGTLGLVLALLVAGTVLFRDLASERGGISWESVLGGQRGEPPGDQIVHLLSFEPAEVVAVRLQRGGREWRTERSGDGWSGIAHPAEIDDFLKDLLDLAEIMPIDAPATELADHGLDPPEAVVELQRRDRPSLTLLIGSHNPSATATYAQLGPGGRVVLTGALASWELDKAIRAMGPADAAP